MMITFKSDVAKRKRFFVPESFAHPAKMSLGLLLWLVGKYTKPGDIILDPMAGAGSTMLATRYGRNVVLVELEEKFVKMAEANWEKVKVLPKLKQRLGYCQILQGDARQLEGLLVDKCIFSPPYAETKKDDRRAFDPEQIDKRAREFEKAGGNFHTPGRMATIARHYAGYTQDPENIGNLPYGQVDKVIDAIITSPLYEGTDVSQTHMTSDERGDPTNPNYRPSWKRKLAEGYAKTKRPYVDAVITSPPYEKTISRQGGDMHRFDGFIGESCASMREYGDVPSNIGNLKSTSYLEAMLQVYQQCYKVLKPNGLMILVTKDFIRNKERVLLSIDTLKLCEQVGFVLEDWHERRLTQQSFWRVIYSQKHPEVEKLETEDILVFRKGTGEGEVDKIITSPPYAEGRAFHDLEFMGKTAEDQKQRRENGKIKGHSFTVEARRRVFEKAKQGKINNPNNISNLPYGEPN